MAHVRPNDSQHIHGLLVNNIGTKNLIPSGVNRVHGRTGVIQDLALGVQNKINGFIKTLIPEMVENMLRRTLLRGGDFGFPRLNAGGLFLGFPLCGLFFDPLNGRRNFEQRRDTMLMPGHRSLESFQGFGTFVYCMARDLTVSS